MPPPANIRTVEPPHGWAPVGPLSDDELSWANRLVLCGHLGWHVAGRDEHGCLVAATTLRAGRDAPRAERYCTITLTPAGLVYRTTTRAIAPDDASG